MGVADGGSGGLRDAHPENTDSSGCYGLETTEPGECFERDLVLFHWQASGSLFLRQRAYVRS